jgi:hypothetical protein
MEERLRAIEDRLLTFETKSDHFATKDDVHAVEASIHRELHQQTWKLISVIAVLFGGALAVARLMH